MCLLEGKSQPESWFDFKLPFSKRCKDEGLDPGFLKDQAKICSNQSLALEEQPKGGDVQGTKQFGQAQRRKLAQPV